MARHRLAYHGIEVMRRKIEEGFFEKKSFFMISKSPPGGLMMEEGFSRPIGGRWDFFLAG